MRSNWRGSIVVARLGMPDFGDPLGDGTFSDRYRLKRSSKLCVGDDDGATCKQIWDE